MAGSKKSKLIRSVEATPTSPFLQIRQSFYLTLSPWAYNFPVEGLCAEHIAPNLMTYFQPLHGVLLAFRNPAMSEQKPELQLSTPPPESVLAESNAEYGVSYVWLTCDFLVFRPERGTTLEGKIHLQNEGVVSLMCYNYFNAAIASEKLPKDWTWDGEQWLDPKGDAVVGQTHSFRVEDFLPSGHDNITISGTLA